MSTITGNKAALLQVLKKLSPKTIAGLMTVNKTFHEVGTVALRANKAKYEEKMRKVQALKNNMRRFVKKSQSNDAYHRSTGARIRKLALVSRAHDLGLYKKTRPNPRGGFLGRNRNAPNYLNRPFVKNLEIITHGGYFMKYPRSPVRR